MMSLQTTMTLYHGEPNGPSLTVLAAILEKDLDVDLIHIDLQAGERHGHNCQQGTEVEMSVEGEGPVLDVNGVAMADSVFIACYFDEIGSGTPLRPADPYARWQVMMWCRYVIERVAPAAAFLGTRKWLAPKLAAHNDGLMEAIVRPIHSDDLRERWRAVRAGEFSPEQVADSEAKIAEAIGKIEAQLDGREWLMGDFGLADLETYAWIAAMPELLPDSFAKATRTNAWLARIKARPSVARALTLATGNPLHAWAPGPEINRWG